MLPIPPQSGRFDRAWYYCALAVVGLASIFSAFVAAQLIWQATHPVIARDPAPIAPLKQELFNDGTNAQLKQQIRALDVQVRRDDQIRRAQVSRGAYMLLIGVGVVLLGAKVAHAYRRHLPAPPAADGASAQDHPSALAARFAVGAIGVLLLSAAAIAAFSSSGHAPWPTDAALEAAGEPPYPPSPAVIHRNWGRFRGPDGSGVCLLPDIPIEWGPGSGKTLGKNVLWKTQIPLAGPNSPVVWGDRVFVSGANKGQGEVYCLNAATGEMIWRKCVQLTKVKSAEPGSSERETPSEESEEREGPVSKSPYATPTMAVDGTYAFAMFYQGELACFDWSGNLVWQKLLDVSGDQYGHANSLLLWRDRLIVQLDRGNDEKNISKIVALDVHDGKVVWEKTRQHGGSWATPIIIGAAGQERLITAAQPWVVAYNPENGKEQWSISCLAEDVAPSPVFAGGLIIITKQGSETFALRPDGSGELPESAIIWHNRDVAPTIASPAATDDLVFLATVSERVGCLDLKDGTRELWHHDFDGSSFQASPSIVGDKVYLLSEQGVMFIVAAGREFKQLGRNELGEKCYASPAFAPGRIFLRAGNPSGGGNNHVYCIGTAPGSGSPSTGPSAAEPAARPVAPGSEAPSTTAPGALGHSGGGVAP